MASAHFGVKTAQVGEFGDYWTLRKVWLEAEKLGFDSGWVYDHLYEHPRIGVTDAPSLEAWTVLSAMAEATQTLRLGVMVLCVGYRNPAMLAKMASTLDVISQGRLEFGLGAGWAKVEHTGFGIPFPGNAERISRLREAAVVMKKMWTEDKACFTGRYYSVNDAINTPKPVQKPHPPLWIGGSGEKLTFKVVAELADGCNFTNLTPSEYDLKLKALEKHCVRFGRTLDNIKKSIQTDVIVAEKLGEVKKSAEKHVKPSPNQSFEDALAHRIVGTPDECVEQINSYVKVGVSHFITYFPDLPDNIECLRLFADRVMPAFR